MQFFTLNRSATRPALVIALFAVLLAGCSAPVRDFTHTDADVSFYEKVGVVPFRSMTADNFAGEKFTAVFTTALLASQKFEVVDSGVFASTLKQVAGVRAPEDALTPEQLKKIGEAAGLQGIFVGSVSQYEMQATGAGPFPVITVDARLVDVATGTVVWRATASERGGPKTPIIGVGEVHTIGALADRISREMIETLK